MNPTLQKFIGVIMYGWSYSNSIVLQHNPKKNTLSIFCDMLYSALKYSMGVTQYVDNNFWLATKEERKTIGLDVKKQNKEKYNWWKIYLKNWKFLNKYTSIKYETSVFKRRLRSYAYKRQYGLGKGFNLQYGVMFIYEHYSIGKLTTGKNILFARNIDIDLTGDLDIGNDVDILEGVKILTHAHDSYHFMKDSYLLPYSNRAYKTNLKIGDNVTICAHAIILPGVTEIGENSIISAGAVVNRHVPANVIVAGNPAVVVKKIPVSVKRTKH